MVTATAIKQQKRRNKCIDRRQQTNVHITTWIETIAPVIFSQNFIRLFKNVSLRLPEILLDTLLDRNTHTHTLTYAHETQNTPTF